MKKTQHPLIISIDWDHTFRNMAGIDLGILSLVLYAKAKQIPVGITTHRDLENTTLYTLYPWQHQIADDEHDALAAAISYWDEHLFKPLNITFDFINARHQVRYAQGNYYEDKLLPLEKKLAQEIIHNHILNNPALVREKIQQYAMIEEPVFNNDAKQAQIVWLSQQFSHHETFPMIFHIDDSHEVIQQLPFEFPHVQTIFYEHAPFFSNQGCEKLLSDIGFIEDIQNFSLTAWLENPLQGLALCLALLQFNLSADQLFMLEQDLKKLKPLLNDNLLGVYQLIIDLLTMTKANNRQIYLLDNHFKLTIG